MKKLTYFTSLLLLLLLSCEKDFFSLTGEVTIRGRVFESGTTIPVANALVGLFESSGEFFGGKSEISTIRTDEEGRYEFTFEKQRGRSYRLKAEAAGYYGLEGSDPVVQDFELDLFLIADGYILIQVENIPPQNVLDRISINLIDCIPTFTSFVGDDVKENVICTFRGNRENRVGWIIEPQGEDKAGYDTLMYFPAHDTIRLTIQY
ncbi:MAG: carboxypeptidase-like regulatory domain-containing protein [Bacteroidota bacterium]